MQVTGIILAGGKSLRMGTDKAFIELEGKSLLVRAIELCHPVCTSLLISSNNKNHQISGYKTIPDEIKNCGPLGGIYTCLKQSETDWNFIISVDAAFVEPDFISYIVSETGDFDAIAPFHSAGKEPLISMYHKNGLTTMRKMLNSGDFKMHNLLNSINTKFVDSQIWIEKFPKIFSNLNRPDDL